MTIQHVSTASELNQKIDDIINYLFTKLNNLQQNIPVVGMILGSGLGEIANNIDNKTVISYKDIPHLPNSTAPSHAGNLVFGEINGVRVMIMQGRLHLYEGYLASLATILVRVMSKIGIKKIIITAAAGGLHDYLSPGSIMLIKDHVNFSGTNPLLGENLVNFGARFPNMFDIYTPKHIETVLNIASKLEIPVYTGVYGGILGPMYATRTELQCLIDNHCDLIGMSVIQEAIIAAHSGMEILALAVVTDLALPNAQHHATEEEVVEAGIKAKSKVYNLLSHTINLL